MKAFILGSIFTFCFFVCSQSQTEVSGSIINNTVWTAAKSPYHATGSITVFPGYTLTIEPGVIIEFADGKRLEIRGALEAFGTSESPILFSSSSPVPNKGIWKGLFVNHELGGSGSLRFCKIEFAENGVVQSCCGNGAPLTLEECTLSENFYGLTGGSNNPTIIYKCTFNNNTYGVSGSDKEISYSKFFGNQAGVYHGQDLNISYSSFCHNGVGLYGHGGMIDNCTIIMNATGISNYSAGFYTITSNIITKNTIGIKYNNTGTQPAELGASNKICGNFGYNMFVESQFNVSAPYNCWCETDSVKIAEKILDGHDNPAYGLAHFSPIETCGSIAAEANESCDIMITGIPEPSVKTSVSIFPNPAAENCTVIWEKNEDAIIFIYDLSGKEVRSFKNCSGTVFTFSLEELNTGIYFLSVQQRETLSVPVKLIVK